MPIHRANDQIWKNLKKDMNLSGGQQEVTEIRYIKKNYSLTQCCSPPTNANKQVVLLLRKNIKKLVHGGEND